MGDARTKTDVTYINDIRKSTADKRAYRGLILPNQLKVLLISDIETDKSAASLGISVGSMNDPDDLPGLAHFCEHILDMGSEKYPGENEYNKFVSDHGGFRNGFICEDLTVHYFDVDCKQLKNALDRFAQFFICPLITQSAVERVVNVVNSLYERKIPNDLCRLTQLERSKSKSGHPYHRFGYGNKMTLSSLPQENGIDVRKELLNFYEKWYSANIMTLIVLGKESLEDLEKMVVPIFSEISNKNVKRPEWLDHPYGQTQVRTRTDVVPVKDLKLLRVSFPVPDLSKYYKAKPYRYITHLINHKCPGSLLSVLKAKNWVNSYVTASYDTPAKGFGFFRIHADLTSYGVNHVKEIMTLLFQYLNMLRKIGPQKWIFEECQKLDETQFRFQNKEDPISFVKSLQYFCSTYPLEEMISSPHLMEDWRPDLIEKLLSDHLNPSNVTVTVVAQEFESTCHELEPWYGTKYKREKIPEDVIREWENSGTNDEFKLPNPNEFVPSNFDILFKGEKGSGLRHPSIIQETSFLKVWFKQDDKFLLPKANLKFEFYSSLVYLDPFNYGLTYLFIKLLNDSLNECTYYAKLAGLSYDIYNSGDVFILDLSGFNEKQKVLLTTILQKMVDFKVDPRRFDVLKEKYIRELKNFKVDDPFNQSNENLKYLLTTKVWTKEQILEACIKMKKTHLDEFIPRLLSKLYVECLFHGNIDRKSAKSLIEIIERILFPKKRQFWLPKKMSRYPLKINSREYLVKEVTNKALKSSFTGVMYQCCKVSIENKMLTELFIQLIEEPCFNILRTKEQLGYFVDCYLWSSYSVVGPTIIVQSDKHPNFVDQRIEAFLVQMREAIKNMNEEEFDRNKESLATKKFVKPKKLSDLSKKLWVEIVSPVPNFDREEIEAAYLKTINKNDVLKYFDTYIQYGGRKRKKLSVHVIPEAEGGNGKLPQTDLNFSSISTENEPHKIEGVINRLRAGVSYFIQQKIKPIGRVYHV